MKMTRSISSVCVRSLLVATAVFFALGSAPLRAETTGEAPKAEVRAETLKLPDLSILAKKKWDVPKGESMWKEPVLREALEKSFGKTETPVKALDPNVKTVDSPAKVIYDVWLKGEDGVIQMNRFLRQGNVIYAEVNVAHDAGDNVIDLFINLGSGKDDPMAGTIQAFMRARDSKGIPHVFWFASGRSAVELDGNIADMKWVPPYDASDEIGLLRYFGAKYGITKEWKLPAAAK
jgi:hypothetical protein